MIEGRGWFFSPSKWFHPGLKHYSYDNNSQTCISGPNFTSKLSYLCCPTDISCIQTKVLVGPNHPLLSVLSTLAIVPSIQLVPRSQPWLLPPHPWPLQLQLLTIKNAFSICLHLIRSTAITLFTGTVTSCSNQKSKNGMQKMINQGPINIRTSTYIYYSIFSVIYFLCIFHKSVLWLMSESFLLKNLS